MSDYVVSVAYMTASGDPNYSVSNDERSVSTFDVGFANQIARSLNACAGLNPEKLAALLESIDYMKRGYELWLAPECPPEEVGSPSWVERQERVFAALAELRGAAS